MHKRLLSATTIQAVLAGLIALYVLVGCTGSSGAPSPKTKITTTATSAGTPTPVPTPQGIIWSDEFDGPKGAPPDASKWTPRIGGEGWGNQQLDYDTDQNAYQDGQGNLVLEARQETPDGSHCWYGPCQYTSSQITTKDHFTFTYGRLEARIKLPAGQGLWSTFWLVDNDCTKNGWQPSCGEVDIMENIGREPGTNYGTAHGPGYFTGTYKLPHGVFSDDFHVFALQWSPNNLYFFVDGINYYTAKASDQNQANWVYNRPYYIILNVAIGGDWPGSPNATTVFPQKMLVSYVRLFGNK
jgi:beta-glucanase (GH16 family)